MAISLAASSRSSTRPGGKPVAVAWRAIQARTSRSAEGNVLEWTCARSCGAHGRGVYDSPELAGRYAVVLNREDRHDIGRRPLLSLLPLRLIRRD